MLTNSSLSSFPSFQNSNEPIHVTTVCIQFSAMHIHSFICINHERLFGAPSDGASMRFESQAKSTREGGIRTLEARFVFGGPALGLPALLSHPFSRHQDGRVVKALDLSSNGQMSAWVRTPLLVKVLWRDIKTQLNRSPISIDMIAILYPTKL